jgi:hypothetical protein
MTLVVACSSTRPAATARKDTGSQLRSAGSVRYADSIARNIRNRDAASLRIACDLAGDVLGGSSSLDEQFDWNDLADACDAALADGDWSGAQRIIEEIRGR